MEEVQKNETGTTVPETDGRPLKEEKAKTGTDPAAGATTKENDCFSPDVPCLCRLYVPDFCAVLE